MTIAVIGIGYVGAALAATLAKRNDVRLFDVRPENVKLSKCETLCSSLEEAVEGARFAFICVPTDYDEKTQRFDLSAVDSVLESLSKHLSTCAVIKSTVPVGYTEEASKRHPGLKVLFAPEFLREAHAEEDCLHPARIVIGSDGKENEDVARELGELLLASTDAPGEVPLLYVGSKEAEAIKLFSNTYLALRVAYFNELDTYAMYHDLSTKEIIAGVCLDPRIGEGYNNPSFGYGGYCLPKDSKQLLHSYDKIPQNLIEAIVKSNKTRKETIAEAIANSAKSQGVSSIGFYRLTMKAGGDNFRQSALLDLLPILKEKGFELAVYEPLITEDSYQGIPVIHTLEQFKKSVGLIVANRIDEGLSDVLSKVFTRDLFGRD